DKHSPYEHENSPARRTLMEEPERGGNPDQRRTNRNDRSKKCEQRQQRRARYTRNEETNAGHQRLDKPRAEDAVNNAPHRVGGNFEQMQSALAANSLDACRQTFAKSETVPEKKKCNEDAQGQSEQSTANGHAAHQ